MAKYNSWDELYKSKDEILNASMELVEIRDGSMIFAITHHGKRYHASGSHYNVGDYNWSPGDTLMQCSDFDSLWLYEHDGDGLITDEICNW